MDGDTSLLESVPAGAAVATSATATLSGVEVTADNAGTAGNDITVEFVDPAANGATLGVVVTGNDIVVNLATDAGSAITSTQGEVATAVNGAADPTAGPVTATATTAGDVVTAVAQTSLTGGANSAGGGVQVGS